MTQSVFWKIGIYQVKGGKTPEGSRPCFLGGTTNRIWLENGISPARSDRQEQELVVPCCAVVSSLAYPASTEKQNEQTCILERSLWTVENELAGAGLFQYSHSVVSDPVIPWNAARQSSLSLTNSQGLLKLMSIELVMPSNHLILCHPLFLLPSIFPSIRVFSNESVLCIRWPKYCNVRFNISPSNEYSRLISFRMDYVQIYNNISGRIWGRRTRALEAGD